MYVFISLWYLANSSAPIRTLSSYTTLLDIEQSGQHGDWFLLDLHFSCGGKKENFKWWRHAAVLTILLSGGYFHLVSRVIVFNCLNIRHWPSVLFSFHHLPCTWSLILDHICREPYMGGTVSYKADLILRHFVMNRFDNDRDQFR
jgi:hypothetical protein